VIGQALDLAKTATIVWQHKTLAAALITLGLVGNIGYTLARPEVYSSSAFVVLPPSVNLSSQAVVATSVPVLSNVLRTAHLGLSLSALQDRVRAAATNGPKISVTAEGQTAQQAEQTANAVTRSYLTYVTSPRNPDGQQAAELLQPAQSTIAKPRTTRLYQAAGFGILEGALVALIAILGIWRGDRRLRTRDAIADSIGVPVLASVRTRHSDDTAGRVKLHKRREPGAADAWQLDRVLRGLGILAETGASAGRSAAVLSVSGDKDALALGGQLAALAAARSIPVNHDDIDQAPVEIMTIAVGADTMASPAADLARAEVAILAVSAGVATAEQLARVVASAAGTGLRLAGAVVVNPDSSDETTGLLPQLARSEQKRMPTRLTCEVTGRGR
jgi:capsular polysaccharide biosynthesis protein